HLPQGDIRLYARRRRARRGTVRTLDSSRPAHGLPPRRLLAADGYAEGQADTRGPGREGQDALALQGGLPRRVCRCRNEDWMKLVELAGSGERLSVLCIGAHSDDIEIGAGATILGWIARGVRLSVHWAVLSARGPRANEARASAEAFLAGAAQSVIELAEF